jgi:hypothetical protein
MGDARQLSRFSLRQDQILELNFEKIPEPPSEMLKLPGVRSWWETLQLHDERRIQAFYRMVNNIKAVAPVAASTAPATVVAAPAVTNVTNITQVTQNISLPVLFGTDADPNGLVTGQQYQFYKNTATGEMWVKQSAGTGNTGWI